MLTYILLGVGIVGGCLLDAVSFTIFSQLAAMNLHNRMFRIVICAPVEFFERNSVGENAASTPLTSSKHLLDTLDIYILFYHLNCQSNSLIYYNMLF